VAFRAGLALATLGDCGDVFRLGSDSAEYFTTFLSAMDAFRDELLDNLEEKKRGLAAKARLLELCPVNSKVILRTLRDAHGKYGRILGELFIRDHGHFEPIKALVNVNKKLVEEGHAVEYFGGKR